MTPLTLFLDFLPAVKQLEVFQSQISLAAKLSRPVSVHCVKAHGKVVEFLRREEEVRKKRARNKKGAGSEKAEENFGHNGLDVPGQIQDGRSLPPRIALQ